MTQGHSGLSAKSVTVLAMIAKGHSYQQILDRHPELTYPDIFHAAEEALDATETVPSGYHGRLARIRKKHARAYEKWTAEEEATLIELVRAGLGEDEIATRLQRQPGAVRSRIAKKGLLASQEPDAQLEAEFHQAMLDVYEAAAKHKYHATRFKQLVENRGGVEAARLLLAREEPTPGLLELRELGILEQSAEATVLRERFRPLFTEAERQKARHRLKSLGFAPR